jgi:hypothetical protein
VSAKRVDANQATIVAVLRQVGCSVLDLSPIGKGCPDLLVGRAGRLFLLEVKNPAGKNKVNPLQAAWHEQWPAMVAVVHDYREALRAVGASWEE